jgi:hypothetical protein
MVQELISVLQIDLQLVLTLLDKVWHFFFKTNFFITAQTSSLGFRSGLYGGALFHMILYRSKIARHR